MNVVLRPELEEFVRERVQAGEYASPEDVVAAGLSLLMDDGLDDETLAAIADGEAQLDRGESIPVDVAFEQLRKKHFGK